MIYQERTLAFRQISEGFSSDGSPVSGIVKAERFGDMLTVRPFPFHLAPLTDGRYACILTDGRATEVFDVAKETRRRSPLDIGGPLCALLCFVGAVASPVAMARYGEIRCQPEELMRALALPAEAGRTPRPQARPSQSERPAPAQAEPPISREKEFDAPPAHRPAARDMAPSDAATSNGFPPSGESEGAHAEEADAREPREAEEDSAPRAKAADEGKEYDDEALAEANYFFERIEADDSYYRSVKDEVEESFASLPPFDGFRDSLPNAQFVRSGEYLLGKLYQAGKVRYLLFAAKTKEALPADLRERAYFVPCSLYAQKEGYYVLFQDAGTGETVPVRRA